MKYLKKYKLFLESDGFEISDTDTPDVVMSKEKMNSTMNHIKEYKSKKSLIDALYSKEGSDIKKGLESIIGKEDVKFGRNPFLVQYASLVKLEKDILKLQDDNTNDKIKIDDLNQSVSTTEDSDTKKSIGDKISDIRNRMSERVKKISDTQKEVSTKEKEHNDKMIQLEIEMKDSIKDI